MHLLQSGLIASQDAHLVEEVLPEEGEEGLRQQRQRGSNAGQPTSTAPGSVAACWNTTPSFSATVHPANMPRLPAPPSRSSHLLGTILRATVKVPVTIQP